MNRLRAYQKIGRAIIRVMIPAQYRADALESFRENIEEIEALDGLDQTEALDVLRWCIAVTASENAKNPEYAYQRVYEICKSADEKAEE